MVFRIGGDELVVLCPATDVDQADELLGRLQCELQKLVVTCVNEVSGEATDERVHISFGIASSVEQGPDEVVALADKRMFENKKRWYEREGWERYR